MWDAILSKVLSSVLIAFEDRRLRAQVLSESWKPTKVMSVF
jgi:hypothetical protein